MSTSGDMGPDVDAGSNACHSAADCGGTLECLFWDAGCAAAGRCGQVERCFTDAIVETFCGCDGRTFDLAHCMTEPWARRGACGGALDGGASD